MKRCFELARTGLSSAAPNPLVGSVIVAEGRIIGEGWHRIYGGPHAEVNAIDSITPADRNLLQKATLYVNLEPCAHFGKRPPCADRIIAEKIPHVVICNRDPFPEVDGKGIGKLLAAGIRVETGVLEEEGRALNRRFFTFHERKRPYIVLKWAQTADGLVARQDFSSKWISGKQSRLMTHLWRAQEQAILVGFNTAWYDDPELTSRDMAVKNPVRLVLDRDGKLPLTHKLFNAAAPTLVIGPPEGFYTLPNIQSIPFDFQQGNAVHRLMDVLYQHRIQSVFVEGGSRLLHDFIAAGLWDEARVFTSKNIFSTGIAAPMLTGAPVEVHASGEDVLKVYRNRVQ